MASFDVLPIDYLNKLLFNFDADDEGAGGRYNEVGMDSNNFIANAGTLLWVMFGWVFAVLMHFILKCVGSKI